MSEERVSALEQMFKDKSAASANYTEYDIFGYCAHRVHERDAKLWALVATFQKYQWFACSELLSAILEGKTE